MGNEPETYVMFPARFLLKGEVCLVTGDILFLDKAVYIIKRFKKYESMWNNIKKTS